MMLDGEKGVILQRDKVTYAVAPHIPCGVVTPDTLRRLADVAEKYNVAALKITSAARIAIVGLKEEDVDNVWADLGMSPGAGVGLCVRSIKACPGTTFCKRGIQDSLSMGMKLDSIYHGMELPSKFKLGVSGCPNQCAETCIKDIGLVGMKNGWKLYVGGNGGAKPRLALELMNNISDEEAISAIDRIISFYKENGKRNQRIGGLIDEIGLDEFREKIG